MKEEKRQNLLILMCWLVYVSSYLSRYSYNSNIVAIKDYYGVTNSVTGLVSACFFFAYGTGQLVNGLMCKKYNAKVFLSLSLVLSALINFIIFTLPPISLYKYLWLLNGASLSVLWSLLMLTLSCNLDEKHLTAAMLVMSSTVSAGTVLSYGSSALYNLFGGFRYAFLTGGTVAVVVAIGWFFCCDKLTKPVEETNKGKLSSDSEKRRIDSSVIVMIAVFGVFMTAGNLLKDSLTVWVPQILKDSYGFNDSLSIVLTIALPFLGLFGATLLVGMNKIIKNGIVLNGILFAVSGLCVFAVRKLLNTNYYMPVIVLFGILSLLMNAVNNYCTSFFPLMMRESVNSGLLAGILNACGYVGSTVSAYCMGAVADKSGWNGVFVLLTILCVAAVVFSVPFIFILKNLRAKN